MYKSSPFFNFGRLPKELLMTEMSAIEIRNLVGRKHLFTLNFVLCMYFFVVGLFYNHKYILYL